MTGVSQIDPLAYGATTGLSKLDGVLLFLREIGGSYKLQITLSEIGAQKLGWLLKGGRDFLSITPQMQQAIATEIFGALRGVSTWDAETARRARLVGAEAARQHIVRRFESGGFDKFLWPLTALYREYKAKHNLDPRIGIERALLLNEIKGPAKFEFVKQAA